MSYWERFLSKSNFLLAWRRINTGGNAYYKRFFRHAYLGYEVSLNRNIDTLVDRIRGGVFKPCPPDRIFIPKPSGLQRPVTLLSVEDQLVWQALANLLQKKWKTRRSKVEGVVVFSNLSSPNRIFLFEDWRKSYTRFLSKIAEVHRDSKWVAHFDLAAYYDTISHDHILKLINPRDLTSDISTFVREILKCWSSEKASFTFSHGIPQGPVASSYIAELILLDVDMKMQQLCDRFFYLRYVDDVRLLAHHEDSVREGIISLEQLCRNKGLVPQSKKTSVFYARTKEEAVGKDFSLSPEVIDYKMSERTLFESIDIEKHEVVNVSKLRFFLYRGQPLKKHLDVILELFEKHPEMSDAFVSYLRRFTNNERLIDHLKSLVERKKFPYQYVEGNVWLLLSEVDTERRSQELVNRARARALERGLNIYLRYGLLTYLAPFAGRLGKRLFNRYLYGESVLQGLLLPHMAIHFDHDGYIRVLRQCLIRTKPEAALSGAIRLAYDDIPFSSLGVGSRVGPTVRNCLISLGLAESRAVAEITPFQEIFRTRYRIQITDWKQYLGGEHAHAHKILILAEKAFHTNKSSWLCSMDSFNNILVRAMIMSDNGIAQKTVDVNGELVPYGVLLNALAPFAKKYGRIANTFRELHQRRNTIPEAHPYDLRTAKRSTFLRKGERNYYYGNLRKAYLEVDKAFQNMALAP